MRIHHTNLGFRLFATLIGVGFLAVGIFALTGGGETLTEVQQERATGFGIAATIGGVCALGLTWLVEDLSNIWCRPPKRWW